MNEKQMREIIEHLKNDKGINRAPRKINGEWWIPDPGNPTKRVRANEYRDNDIDSPQGL